MAGLKFRGGALEAIYSSEFNNIVNVSKNAVVSGFDYNLTGGLGFTIGSGRAFFGDEMIEYAGGSFTFTTNTNVNPRTDLIILNKNGNVTKLDGAPNVLGAPPDYNADENIVLYRATITQSVNSLNPLTNFKDVRIFNIGGGGSSNGGTFLKMVEIFSNQTEVIVTHNFGDENPKVFVFNQNNIEIEPSSKESLGLSQFKVTFSSSTSGRIVLFGGNGVNTAYSIKNFSNQSVWNVEHNLNNRYVIVQCVDNNNKRLIPSDIDYVNENNLNIIFGNNRTGRAICTGGSTSLLSVDGGDDD